MPRNLSREGGPRKVLYVPCLGQKGTIPRRIERSILAVHTPDRMVESGHESMSVKFSCSDLPLLVLPHVTWTCIARHIIHFHPILLD